MGTETPVDRDMTPLRGRVVDALPTLCATGAAVMAGLGLVLRNRLAPIDRLAFALDAAGYVVAIIPTARRHPVGWWVLTSLTAAQPAFSVCKLVDGSGGGRELTGRAVSTVTVLLLLIWLKPQYDTDRIAARTSPATPRRPKTGGRGVSCWAAAVC